MLKNFAPGMPLKVFMTNGTHIESLAGQDFTHLLEFVDFYVGKRIPKVSPLLLAGAPAILQGIFGGSPIPIPQSEYAGYPSYCGRAGRLPGGTRGPAGVGERRRRVTGRAGGHGREPVQRLAGAGHDRHAAVPATRRPVWPRPPTRCPTTSPGPTRATSTTPPRSAPRPSTAGRTTSGRPRPRPAASIHWNPLTEGDSLSFVTAAVHEGDRLRRPGQRRSVAALDRARHRPRDDAHHRASRRPGDLRPERLAPGLGPGARPSQSTELYPFHPLHTGGGRGSAGRASSCRRASSCSRSRPCCGPVTACGSTSRRPAATSRSGSSSTSRPSATR